MVLSKDSQAGQKDTQNRNPITCHIVLSNQNISPGCNAWPDLVCDVNLSAFGIQLYLQDVTAKLGGFDWGNGWFWSTQSSFTFLILYPQLQRQ